MRKILLGNKRIYFNNKIGIILLNLMGLNWSYVTYILGICGLDFNTYIKNIPFSFLICLNNLLKLNYVILNILFKQYHARLRLKKQLGSYRGLRLKFGLPVRGQRTHSNAKTAKLQKKGSFANNNNKKGKKK